MDSNTFIFGLFVLYLLWHVADLFFDWLNKRNKED